MLNKKHIIISLSSLMIFNEDIMKTEFKPLINVFSNSALDVTRVILSRMFNKGDEAENRLSEQKNKKYLLKIPTLSFPNVINYQLGIINTDQFIDNLRKSLAMAKGDGKPDGTIESKLGSSWKSGIELAGNATEKLNDLIVCANNNQKIYLISDIDPLHAEKILSLFSEICPNYYPENLPEAITPNQPIEIAKNIYLCPSYIYGAMIEPQASSFFSSLFKSSKISLITEVINSLDSDKDILFVSDNKKETCIAKKLGMTTTSTDHFYNQIKPTVNPTETKIDFINECFPSASKLCVPNNSPSNTDITEHTAEKKLSFSR